MKSILALSVHGKFIQIDIIASLYYYGIPHPSIKSEI